MTFRIFILIGALAAGPLFATSVMSLEAMIGDKFVAKNAASACYAAEEFCYRDVPAWMKEGRALKGRSLGLTRAPAEKEKNLKIGDLVWIVVVDNLAGSDIVATPWAIVWVKAEDGAVFVSTPKDEKKG